MLFLRASVGPCITLSAEWWGLQQSMRETGKHKEGGFFYDSLMLAEQNLCPRFFTLPFSLQHSPAHWSVVIIEGLSGLWKEVYVHWMGKVPEFCSTRTIVWINPWYRIVDAAGLITWGATGKEHFPQLRWKKKCETDIRMIFSHPTLHYWKHFIVLNYSKVLKSLKQFSDLIVV